MIRFNLQKKKQFFRKDMSNKGNWDERIVDLCEKLNANKDYYTTSSCAGRIVLLKNSEKKKKGLFLYRTHNKLSFDNLIEVLRGIKYKGLVYFKQEPCILHVACKSINNAQELVAKAKLCGWKRSGIMAVKKRVMVELMSTEHIEMPIMLKGKLLISKDYLKLIIKEANRKLGRTWKKIKKLYKAV